MFTLSHLCSFFAASLALVISQKANAEQVAAMMTVSAVVEPSCSLDASPLMFQNVKSLHATAIGESTIRLQCTPDQAFSVAIDQGLHASGSRRRMMSEALGASLAYEIYFDQSRTKRWGEGGAEVAGMSPHDGSPVNLTAYGSITQATAAPGNYNDVVTITVQF